MANVPLISLASPYSGESTSSSNSSRTSSVKAETPRKGSGIKKFFANLLTTNKSSTENLDKKEKEEVEAHETYWKSTPLSLKLPIQEIRIRMRYVLILQSIVMI